MLAFLTKDGRKPWAESGRWVAGESAPALIQSDKIHEALQLVPGFSALVKEARRGAGGLELLHATISGKQQVHRSHKRVDDFGCLVDMETVVEQVVVISLSGGGAMRVLGCEPTRFSGKGGALSFRAGLWHEPCQVPAVTLSLAFGYFLEPEEGQWRTYPQWRVGVELPSLFRRRSEDEGLGVELATRDLLHAGDILSVVQGTLMVRNAMPTQEHNAQLHSKPNVTLSLKKNNGSTEVSLAS